ncbi:MAG: AMP-binding protein [Bacteroidaceae bacterium]|nr:AMP-binding protein [Bacteroidaceae bacterium]
MAEGTFFITGSTGLLGTEIVHRLLSTTDCTIRVLVRAASTADATYRLQSLWWEDKVLSAEIGKRVLPVTGDITHDRLGMSDADYSCVLADTSYIIHNAAEVGIQKSMDELRTMNIEGTRNMILMADKMPQLKRFVYISTAYVAGRSRGRIMENAPLPSRFNSHYEQSKAEAERMVRETTLPITICRPGMIVGNSQTGRTINFNTIYYVLKQMLQGKMKFLPVSRSQTVNVAPVDYVARLVVELSMNKQAVGRTFHLTAPYDKLPTVGELVSEVRKWAKENLQIDVPDPVCVPVPLMRTIGRGRNAGKGEKRRNILSNLVALMPYFLDDHQFDRTNTDELTGSYDLDWREYLPVLLSFACRHNFMRLTDKTIFEQAMVRRASRHYPVSYYNISAQGIEEISGRKMNALVNRFVGQLRALGVQTGNTVALSGINCTENAAIDNAIGLVGAVSVPIYYTTPAEEIALLLQKSGARWFFVGDERIKSNLWLVPKDVQIIYFGPLATGKFDIIVEKSSVQTTTHVSPFNLATIRYTSGTTGEPKGVMFSFHQLKWMGEVLTNLLSWRGRNSEMRYLSFLPMSHVVEGILAAYAPYCMLCKSKIYYLNDFQMLTKALPKVRPTVFFSVPRFYEKLWEQIEHNPLGAKYLSMKEGSAKKRIGCILRYVVLRKAGLDKCGQLLVGSAPISEELLLRFRALGIEIHNAYGQTEAPLITLNRIGDNVISSIGTPLPDTTVKVNPDGELIVRGPQVAMGYYKMEDDTFKDGELRTGDLGHIDENGHVYIGGRKKDMLITSYGKNINCTKIEQRLTDISCVDQAVLVGEQRPYCTALLWTVGKTDQLQQEIERMNDTLSHPEQVRRWRIIDVPLSIKNGELTPNLKVKRNVVLEHYKQVIDEMYAD